MRDLSISHAVGLDVGELPSIPHVLLKLIEACHKVDVSFDELAAIIQQDVGLRARIVAIANSPTYAQWNDVRDFNRLLVALGLDTIKTIAITSSVHQFFASFNPQVGRWMGGFWQRSLSCAHAARELARLTGYDATDEAYLAGLMHRLGQLVFLKQDPSGYADMALQAEDGQMLQEHERRRFGSSSSEMGAFLLRQWDSGSLLSDAILYQHEPADALLDTPRLIKLLNLAARLSDGRQGADRLHADADLLFGLAPAVIDDLMLAVRGQVQKAAEALAIRLSDDGHFYADSEEIRLALARRVREFALLAAPQRQLQASALLEETIQAALLDLEILFGASHSICFLIDSDAARLRAVAGRGVTLAHIGEFQIALQPGRSMLADAVIEQTVISSHELATAANRSVVDRQLAKLLAAEETLCIPLHTGTQRIGVMVMGVEYAAVVALHQQETLLRSFAEVVAVTIQQRQLAMQERRELIELERERQQEQVRKLTHEANNPLAIIKNYLQVLSLRLSGDDAVQSQLSILSEEIDRVANILLRMRDVAKPSDLPQGAVDINKLLRDLLEVFRVSHFASHGIREHLQLDETMPPVRSNRNSIKQIVTNLIKNAIEAMPDGGEITVATRDQINVDGRPYVELAIADNGPGIPDEVLSSIFTPIKSSKGKGHSGLGLTIVRNLVADLGGSISCCNKRAGGAEFVILLPRNTE